MTNYTPRFSFPVPDFGVKPWQENLLTCFQRIDEVVYQSLIAAGMTAWANATDFEAGQMTVDTEEDGTFWICLITHTSAASPTTFAEDRANNPTYWAASNISPQNRGVWVTDTAYKNTDYVTHGNGYYVCSVSHTSGVFNDDLNNGFWSVLIDLSAVIGQIESAIASVETFNDVYLGTFDADPTEDNDGDPLQEGAMYFNTDDSVLKVWDGSDWISITTSAPDDATYVVRTSNGGLSAERVLTDGVGAGLIIWDWGTAGVVKGKVHVTAGDVLLYSTGADQWAETAITSAARALLDDSTVAAMRTTLGVPSIGGDTFTGSVVVQGDLGTTTGDLYAYTAGSATHGAVYLGNAGTHFLQWDGSDYVLGAKGVAVFIGSNTGDITFSGVVTAETFEGGDAQAGAARYGARATNDTNYANFSGQNLSGSFTFVARANGDVESATGSYGTISDKSVKTNIEHATPKLSDVLSVPIKNFDFTEISGVGKQIGVIDEDVEAAFPSLVYKGPEDGLNRVKTSILYGPIRMKAFQEFVVEARNTIAELTARVESLESGKDAVSDIMPVKKP